MQSSAAQNFSLFYVCWLIARPLFIHFLILGSASPELMRQSSESLAGRISMFQMSRFCLNEIGTGSQNIHWT
jgi:predicted AAA+ superfamily ATPase